MLTHRLDLRERVEDRKVALLVDQLIQQRVFTLPVKEFYRAAVAALAHEGSLAHSQRDNDEVTRDLLRRVVELLDARRPWPQPPFYTVEAQRWPELMANAPVIGRIDITRRHLEEQLSRVFTRTHLGGGEHGIGDLARGEHSSAAAHEREVDLMLLELRGGPLIGLAVNPASPQAGVFVHTRADPQVAITALLELTGLDAQPV